MNRGRKSPKVADEMMFQGRERADEINRGRHGPAWIVFATIYSIIRIPVSVLSCFYQQHGNGADGIWVTGETVRNSEIDHLMVSDSMRYAILM